ncbi:unnamed protein product [Pocillopora meandrina]|uniref:Uncharacterized protein n=1 Tax=Pocillopora meandrina TaxID=46732 RepID=A0AAU9X1K9_9CNID|nr:unnamed protein product [Pocillopora meandrina]
MKQLQSFQNRFAKRILKAKVMSAEALTLFQWDPTACEAYVLKGEIPEHLDVFSSTMSQQHVADLNHYLEETGIKEKNKKHAQKISMQNSRRKN